MQLQVLKKTDLKELWSLFLRTKKRMEEEGNFMWSHAYPSRSLFREDLASGNAFGIWEKGRLIAYVTLSFSLFDDFFYQSRSVEKEKSLLSFVGAKPDEKPVLLHRLMVDPAFQGRGVATEILKELKNKCQGYLALFASSPANDQANRLYERLGFQNDGPYPFEYERGPWLLFHCHF
jgi:RimJ/RimL family protein N-acetyltransferase